jgi:hypothetical protein
MPRAAGREPVADVARVGDRPGEPVEFRYDEGVAFTEGGDRSTVTDSHPSLRLFAYQVSETAGGGCRGTS